jgi:hypothetical protein
MPIEGPLDELGLHEVFQLLDLSRKTGRLRVTSRIRDDEGSVYFERGRVVQATLRSKPGAAIDAAAVTDRELERRLRGQIEGAIFDLMAWREGHFSFEERDLSDVPPQTRVRIATESLLMESARRIDEWSRIADKIPHMRVVPVLAEIAEDHESQLDLLPHEWEVLSLIDGQRDLRAIADLHGHDDFETAKVVYGLVTTGVVAMKPHWRTSVAMPNEKTDTAPAAPAPAEATTLQANTQPAPRTSGRSAAPRISTPSAPLPPAPLNTENPGIMAALNRGYSAARAGELEAACASWERFLALAPDHPFAARVRSAKAAAAALRAELDAHHG